MDGAVVDNYFSFGTGNDNGFYAAIPIPNPDAIQEFKIQTSTYDAGYGRNPGANVNVVTKGGTNAFHGTAFEFFRNSGSECERVVLQENRTAILDGADHRTSRPSLSQNQYGGTFGGPIKKDKLFFFVSYQETSQKNGISPYSLQTPVLPPIPGSNSSSPYNRGTCTTPNWTSLSQCDAATASFVTALATAISPNCPRNAAYAATDTSLTVGGMQVACPLNASYRKQCRNRSGGFVQHQSRRDQHSPVEAGQRQLLHSRINDRAVPSEHLFDSLRSTMNIRAWATSTTQSTVRTPYRRGIYTAPIRRTHLSDAA